MKTKIIIHLINEKVIEFESNYFSLSYYLDKMNDGNCNIKFANYIVPKSSISYIEHKEVESEENNEN